MRDTSFIFCIFFFFFFFSLFVVAPDSFTARHDVDCCSICVFRFLSFFLYHVCLRTCVYFIVVCVLPASCGALGALLMRLLLHCTRGIVCNVCTCVLRPLSSSMQSMQRKQNKDTAYVLLDLAHAASILNTPQNSVTVVRLCVFAGCARSR